MQTAMTTIRLPIRSTVHPDTLQLDFARRHDIEAAFVPYNHGLAIRISAQAYNEPKDYDRLLAALKSHFDL